MDYGYPARIIRLDNRLQLLRVTNRVADDGGARIGFPVGLLLGKVKPSVLNQPSPLLELASLRETKLPGSHTSVANFTTAPSEVRKSSCFAFEIGNEAYAFSEQLAISLRMVLTSTYAHQHSFHSENELGNLHPKTKRTLGSEPGCP